MKASLHLSLALITCLLVSACTPLIFVGGAVVGGAIIYDQRSVKTMKNDALISRDVSRYIHAQPSRIKDQMHVVANVFNGVVLLAGQVPTEQLKSLFQQEAESVDHVRLVYNKIDVGPALTIKARANDIWITTKARTELLATRGLHSSQISVLTENKVIYLMGLVSHKQAHLATESVRKIEGVKKVVTLFEYIQ